ncbi:hypothetical protein DY000_02003565 [Brassica cretica]|uniref:REJ domain-containing protein n=1 Tax=Brassica cretica TaxID=69181 RepID=A0ABQ7C4I3_BRACR|nr:hypothetical protein DY000_02003565 [Brassica cretica]
MGHLSGIQHYSSLSRRNRLRSLSRDSSAVTKAPTLLVISPPRSRVSFHLHLQKMASSWRKSRPESETQTLKTSLFSSSIYKTTSPPWPSLSSTTLSPPSTSADAPLSPYSSRTTSTNPLRLTPPYSASGGTSCSFSFMGCIRLLPKEVVLLLNLQLSK